MKIAITYDHDQLINPKENLVIINDFHDLVCESLFDVLKELGHQVFKVAATLKLEDSIRKLNPDLVFNTSIRRINGSLYAYAPTILERIQIPFTGPSAKACTNIFNKFKASRILEDNEINSPHAIIIDRETNLQIPDSLKFPLFIKPLRGGCSRGISKMSFIKSREEYIHRTEYAFNSTGSSLMIEEFLPGREFTVGVLGNQNPNVLPIMEFVYKEKGPQFRTFSNKMINYESEETICPANLNEKDYLSLKKLTLEAFVALKCRDFARVDIRMDEFGDPKIIEVNAIPNLEPETSSIAIMAMQADISFSELIDKIIGFALERKLAT